MVITSATFIEDIILFIRDFLRTNITDPVSRTSGIGFVMTSYPKRSVQYPIITIKLSNADTVNLGMSSEVCQATVDLEVRIWARNAKESDELTSDVIDVLRDAQYTASTGTDANNIFGFNITSINPIVEMEGDNSIHSKAINLQYRAILT